MLGAQLRLARQYAITQRRRVAVLMPSKQADYNPLHSDTNKILNNYKNKAFRTCFVEGTDFDGWVPNSQWEFVPVGAGIFKADNVSSDEASEYNSDYKSKDPDDLPSVKVNGVYFGRAIGETNDDGATIDNVRAVIFKPTGALDSGSSEIIVTVGEGLYVNGKWIIRNGRNWQDLTLNPYTGRLEYKGPESP
jgi:hypothetical protein